jgi:hypothetical protein
VVKRASRDELRKFSIGILGLIEGQALPSIYQDMNITPERNKSE